MALEDESQDPLKKLISGSPIVNAPDFGGGDELDLPENNPDLESEISKSTILSPEPGASAEDQATVDRIIAGQTPSGLLGDPGSSSLFPGLNQPIQVGQQSGSIIGSQPIFVSRGGPAPVGVIAGRQKALADAAQAKAAARKPFDLPKGPLVDDPRFQKSLNASVTALQKEFIRKGRERHGDDVFVALQSQETDLGREFTRAMDNMDVLAREGNQIVKLFGEVDDAKQSGELILADKTLSMLSDFENLTGDLEGGDINKLGNLRERLNELKGSISLDKHLNNNKFLTSIKGRLVERAGVKDFGEYLKITESGTLSFKEDIAVIAKGLKRDEFKSSPISEEEIAERLGAIMGGKKTKSIKVSQKKKGSGGGFDVSPDKIITADGTRGVVLTGGGEAGLQSYTPFGTPGKAEKTFNVAGLVSIDPVTNKKTKVEGTENFQPVGLGVNEETGEKVIIAKTYEMVPVRKDLTAKQRAEGKTEGRIIKDNLGATKMKKVETTKMYEYLSVADRIKTEAPNVSKHFETVSEKETTAGAADNL